MNKFIKIPLVNGLYWYYANGCAPEIVKIDIERYGEGKFKCFNNAVQSWMREGEYLIGPQPAPENNGEDLNINLM